MSGNRAQGGRNEIRLRTSRERLPAQGERFEMKIPHRSRMALAIVTVATLATSSCTVGKYPPDEHKVVAKPFIHDSAATDPLGVLMAGSTAVHENQVFNLSDEALEGGSEVQMISALPDNSSEALAKRETLYESVVRPFTAPPDSEEGFDSSKLPPALWTEHGTLLNKAERGLLRLRDEKRHANNPLAYIEQLGLLLYSSLELNYAPQNDRFAAIIQRLDKTPGYLQVAQSNLQSSSEVFIAAARESTQGVVNLIRNDIADRMPASMKADFDDAAERAVSALEQYREALGSLPSSNDWRAGATLVHRKLELDTGQPLAPLDDLIATTEEAFEEAHSSLVSAAEPINRRIYGGSRPRDDFRLINDVLEVLEGENRARNNQGMMDAMTRDADEARKLCNDEEIAPVPEALELRVVETPEFMRISVPLGGGLGPTAAKSDNTAIVWLTPAPADASRAELRDRLTTNNVYQLKLQALRYGIPGYALIGSLASDMESDEKKLTHLVDPLPGFVDGWPLYIMETTVGTAYTGDVDFIWRKYKLQTIGAALIDMQMHAGDLDPVDAVEFLTRRAYMESSAARALVRAIQVNPTQSATAYLGWLGWQQLRAHYQETTQDFSLTSFHGKALRTGAMPLTEFSYAVSDARGRLNLSGDSGGGEGE